MMFYVLFLVAIVSGMSLSIIALSARKDRDMKTVGVCLPLASACWLLAAMALVTSANSFTDRYFICAMILIAMSLTGMAVDIRLFRGLKVNEGL